MIGSLLDWVRRVPMHEVMNMEGFVIPWGSSFLNSCCSWHSFVPDKYFLFGPFASSKFFSCHWDPTCLCPYLLLTLFSTCALPIINLSLLGQNFVCGIIPVGGLWAGL